MFVENASLGSLVSRCLYMILICFGGFVMLNWWLDSMF
jgi:hypothetical protein